MTVQQLVERAEARIQAGEPIQLDLFSALMAAGIDVEELERTARNGSQETHRFDVV